MEKTGIWVDTIANKHGMKSQSYSEGILGNKQHRPQYRRDPRSLARTGPEEEIESDRPAMDPRSTARSPIQSRHAIRVYRADMSHDSHSLTRFATRPSSITAAACLDYSAAYLA